MTGLVRELDEIEQRVLGSLVEKERVTPQQYPMTVNALVAACNQTSNRAPVLHLTDTEVADALVRLRQLGVTRVVHSVQNRAAKHRHVLDEVLGLDERELAVVAVLLLRGPQTPGELRTRTERLAELTSLEEVETVLDGLADRAVPLVSRLERRPGQKEARWAHRLGGEPLEPVADPDAAPSRPPSAPLVPAPADVASEGLRAEVHSLRTDVASLRREVASLRTEVDSLRTEVDSLRTEVEPLRVLLD